jgi:hypothetical protein
MKRVENSQNRKRRTQRDPRTWNARRAVALCVCDHVHVTVQYATDSVCLVTYYSKYKFQLNWILTKQSPVLPTQKLRVIRDILVESVLNIRSMYAYP